VEAADEFEIGRGRFHQELIGWVCQRTPCVEPEPDEVEIELITAARGSREGADHKGELW